MAPRPKPSWFRRVLTGLKKRALSTFGGIFGAPTSSGYKGGQLNRLTQDWVMLPLSADQEIRWNARAVRARARELCRDNPIAKRFLQLVASNVVGAKGIRLEARIATLTGDPSAGVNAALEQAWEEWGRATTASADGRQSWTELQRTIAKNLAQDGEVILRSVKYFDNKFGYTLQLIDPDRLDFLYVESPGKNQNRVRFGVEMDDWGRPVAYHVWKHHPAEFEYDRDNERIRIPAEEIIHLYIADRVDQTRGISWFHAVMLALKMYDGYQEAELVAARTAAAKMGFIVSPPDSYQAPADADERITMEVEPGLFEQLDPGYDFKTWDPQHPTTAFESFSKQVLKSISAGLSVTHATLSHDLSEANYSSLRAGLLPERDYWRMIQDYVIEHCHRRVFADWLSMAILTGQVKAGMRGMDTMSQVRWAARGWEWVDPLNEMRAAALGIDYGLRSRTRIVADQGEDLEEVFADLSHEQKLAEENDINLAPVNVQPKAKAPSETTPAPASGEGETGDGAAGTGTDGGRRLAFPRAVP